MREAFKRVKVPLFGIFGIVAITLIAFAVVKPEALHKERQPFSITGNAVLDSAMFDGAIDDGGPCSALDQPVCGTDGTTYKNLCFARAGGVEMRHAGACDSAPVTQ